MPAIPSDGTALSKLPSARFGEVSFLAENFQARGGFRIAEHEHLKRAGAQIEKLGRKRYGLSARALFHDTLSGPGEDGFPYKLDKLLRSLERGDTLPLVVPHLGVLDAICTSWNANLEAKIRSGVAVDLEWVEDSQVVTLEELIDTRTESANTRADAFTSNLNSMFALDETPEPIDTLSAEQRAKLLKSTDAATASTIDLTLQTLSGLRSFLATPDYVHDVVSTRVEGLLGLFARLEKTPPYQRPQNWPAIDALLRLWESLVLLQQDIARVQLKTALYEVPSLLTVGEVSIRLYGDPSHGVELAQINPIEDLFRIPAGTKIRYYLPEQAQAA